MPGGGRNATTVRGPYGVIFKRGNSGGVALAHQEREGVAGEARGGRSSAKSGGGRRRPWRRCRQNSARGGAPGDDELRESEEGVAAQLQDTLASPVVPGGHAGGSTRSGGGSAELAREQTEGARGGV